jgi:hypothetical protein
MPSISLSPPGAPTLLTGLSPIAANPIAAIDGAAPPAFASVIDGMGQGFTFDVSLPLKPSVGKTLPPERPEIAGGPEPLPVLDVEAVMIGSTGEVPAAPVVDPAPPPAIDPVAADPAGPVADQAAAVAADPVVVEAAADEPVPTITMQNTDAEPKPISDGLRHWRLGGASIPVLAHAIARPLPAPVRLPPEEVPDIPAIDPTPLPEQGEKNTPPDPQPESAQAADVPAAPPFAGIVWTPLPPQPVDDPAEPVSDLPALPQPGGAARATVDPQLPATASPAPDAPQPTVQQPVQPGHVPTQPAALPQSFSVPPEVAREVAKLVQAATGERDERAAPETVEPASLPTVSTPQIAVAQPAPLHPAFAASHRPVIDTGRAEWMQAMIDRIAEMPQAEGGRRDAQIRLVPDALGPVEVKIEQRQERLHVTLQAETPQARQLLSDAAPKLHELAEARGIRFAQTGFGSTDSQDRRQTPDQQQPATPLRPRPAGNAADADTDSQDDGDLIA